MAFDLDTMTLRELLALRGRMSEVLVRRFERNQAVVFSDIVGSTEYFAQFGDEAGRGLQQRHVDLLSAALPRGGGAIVDTAGDGAFSVFPTVGGAIAALVQLEHLILSGNVTRAPEHHLAVRCGVNWGAVLTDGAVVTGDAVNLCARITASAAAGEIRLTRAAWQELPPELRERCEEQPPARLKGIARPVELLAYEWRERGKPPNLVRIEESGAVHPLPDKPTITFGRLKLHEGAQANDIVLSMPDKTLLMAISRWHFELRQAGGALYLHPVSDQATEVDGKVIPKGQRAPVVAGTVVRLAGAMTLTFLHDADRRPSAAGGAVSGEWATGGVTLELKVPRE